MIPGTTTLELVQNVLARGATHIALLMRHSAREYAPGKHDLLNPLTDEGREFSRSLGEKLPKSLLVRGYTSPAERCVETAALIMAGHAGKGGAISRNRIIEALGVFYVLDQMKMYKAMQAEGGLVPLLNAWFGGTLADDILMPPDIAARLVGRLSALKLEPDSGQAKLDLLVSHDFTLYTIKDRLLAQSPLTYPDVHYLDGVAFFNLNGKTYVQSHHGDPIELNT
jgi:broad specificity phosphatase PhoE